MNREPLTHTRMATFKDCRRKYKYRFVDLIELRAAKPGRRRGSAFGAAIFAANQAGEDGQWTMAIIDAVGEHYGPLVESSMSTEQARDLEVESAKVRVMAQAYIVRYGFDTRRELTFELPLRKPDSGWVSRRWYRAGKIDGLIPLGGNHARLVEDKFVSQITDIMIQRLPLDSQITEYADALAAKGWTCEVEYRHTRFPGINPEKAKTYKSKPDKQAETIYEFEHRLVADLGERPDFYFSKQTVVFDPARLEEHRLERWQVAKEIEETEHNGRFFKTTSHCLEFGGCDFLPLCTDGWGVAGDMYVPTTPTPELGA